MRERYLHVFIFLVERREGMSDAFFGLSFVMDEIVAFVYVLVY
jgi:hypothetical protein